MIVRRKLPFTACFRRASLAASLAAVALAGCATGDYRSSRSYGGGFIYPPYASTQRWSGWYGSPYYYDPFGPGYYGFYGYDAWGRPLYYAPGYWIPPLSRPPANVPDRPGHKPPQSKPPSDIDGTPRGPRRHGPVWREEPRDRLERQQRGSVRLPVAPRSGQMITPRPNAPAAPPRAPSPGAVPPRPSVAPSVAPRPPPPMRSRDNEDANGRWERTRPDRDRR